MSTDNLYWPVYKNLEREVLALSNHIHFDDNQLIVYSVKIAELLLRCVTEIEAISKDLYETNGGDMYPKDNNGKNRQLYFDTDCLEYFERIWTLSKKQVIVSAISFYFKKDENKILTPLKNANKHGKCDWKRAYQSIKHNRSKEIRRANVKHLVRALAALYLLNIYYKDEKIQLPTVKYNNDILMRHGLDCRLGSEIFSIRCEYVEFENSPITNIGSTNYDADVYIYKHTDYAYQQMVKLKQEDDKAFKDFALQTIIENLNHGKVPTVDDIQPSLLKFQDDKLQNRLREFVHLPREIILNKGQKIYPNQ